MDRWLKITNKISLKNILLKKNSYPKVIIKITSIKLMVNTKGNEIDDF